MNWQEEFNQAITECKKVSDEIISLTKKDNEMEREQNGHQEVLKKNAPSKFWILVFVIIAYCCFPIIARSGYWKGGGSDLGVMILGIGVVIGFIIYSIIIVPLKYKSNPECRYHKKMKDGLVLERMRIRDTRYRLITQKWKSAKVSAHRLQKSATYQQLKENNIGDKYNRGVLELDNLFKILIGKKQDKSKDTNGWLIAAGVAVALLGVAAVTSSAVKSAGKDIGS